MKKVFVCSTNIISPLGITTMENFRHFTSGVSAVMEHSLLDIQQDKIWASLFSQSQIDNLKTGVDQEERFSRFELMLINSVKDALKDTEIDPGNSRTIFICSTTKGNILELENNGLDKYRTQDLELFGSAKKLCNYFGNPNQPVLVSNACISGVAALIIAKRLLQTGTFDHAIVCGADTFSRFVYSGFLSFQALSPGRCKPFSGDRDGINLGEAAATIILSNKDSELTKRKRIQVMGGSMSNDANHISGPSRTGEELCIAIKKSLHESKLEAKHIDFISAHGTATPYNDEMEAKAITLAGLQNTPLNSMKGYVGHTLGAAGLLESVISMEALLQGVLPATAGYSKDGLKPEVNICKENFAGSFQACLKTASGFGGCNAAIIYSLN